MIIDQTTATALGVNTARLAYLDAFLTKAASDMINPAIAITVAYKDVEIFNGAYGPSSPGGPPLKLDMITDVQSVTKPFTATAIMLLQEDGLLEIKEPLQNFFPDFAGEYKEEVVLWQLMSHVSGMSDDAVKAHVSAVIKETLGENAPGQDAPWAAWEDAVKTVSRMQGLTEAEIEKESWNQFWLRIGLGAPLANRPNTQFDYSSEGYNLLASLVEKLAGESMDAFLTRRVFAPLGMVDSHFVLPEEKWPRVLLRGDTGKGGRWMDSDENKVEWGGSSGLKTTMPDLLRFGLMFYHLGTWDGVRILSPASVRMMSRDHNKEIPKSWWHGKWYQSNWGLGWNVRQGKFDSLNSLRSDRTYDHAGWGGARLMIDPDNDLVAAYYMVDAEGSDEDNAYALHAKTANIIYSALG
ncbi:MAG: beta-lactamase family protein [Clostridiales bacterium]|nr:beta-lactamase family protein [Clostridiales bacterium]